MEQARCISFFMPDSVIYNLSCTDSEVHMAPKFLGSSSKFKPHMLQQNTNNNFETYSSLPSTAVGEAMAVALAITDEGGQYNGRMTLFVVLSCMMAAMGGVIFGYDIGISDTKISNYCKFDSQLLTSFTSSLYVAGLFATFLASSVTKAFGRKPSILAGGAAFLAGSALGGAALNVYMLIFGRILLGIGVGFANQSVPLYLSEMAPPRYRGAINNGFQFSIGIGALVANLINFGTEKIEGGWGWRISLAMAAVPASILTLGAIFLPETPNSLIQNSSDHDKAKTLLQRIRGTSDVQAELDDLIKASLVAKSINHPIKKIIQRKYRPQLVMAIAIPFFQQVTGINVIAFYAPILFRTIGIGESASLLSSVVTGVVGAGSTFISMLIVDKFGRRALFMVGGIQMFVSQMLVGGIMAAQLGDHGTVSKGYAYLVIFLICIYVAGFGWSWGPLGWLVPSEIYQLEIRSAGQSITVAVSFVFTFVVAQTFLSMLCHFKAGIFFFFGGWVVVMTAFVYFLLPETKNVPIEQMEKVWKEHWFWKRIVGEEDDEIKIHH
ncbi:Major facilitator [Theobroma cacao]|nr:Major facilitator [Theobroma cacao]